MNKHLKAYKGIKNRKVYIDFDLLIDYSQSVSDVAAQQHKALKHLDPFYNLVGKHRKYQNPAELEKRVEEDFNSCVGYAYDQDGHIIKDEKGVPIKVPIKPYTMSGLAYHLGLSTKTLSRYEVISRAGGIPPEYAEIVLRARQRIETYAEEQIYTRDGSRGAQFVLMSGFKWITPKEKSDIKVNKKRIKLQQEEFKMKQKLLGNGDGADDTQLEIRVVRASKMTEAAKRKLEDEE